MRTAVTALPLLLVAAALAPTAMAHTPTTWTNVYTQFFVHDFSPERATGNLTIWAPYVTEGSAPNATCQRCIGKNEVSYTFTMLYPFSIDTEADPLDIGHTSLWVRILPPSALPVPPPAAPQTMVDVSWTINIVGGGELANGSKQQPISNFAPLEFANEFTLKHALYPAGSRLNWTVTVSQRNPADDSQKIPYNPQVVLYGSTVENPFFFSFSQVVPKPDVTVALAKEIPGPVDLTQGQQALINFTATYQGPTKTIVYFTVRDLPSPATARIATAKGENTQLSEIKAGEMQTFTLKIDGLPLGARQFSILATGEKGEYATLYIPVNVTAPVAPTTAAKKHSVPALPAVVGLFGLVGVAAWARRRED